MPKTSVEFSNSDRNGPDLPRIKCEYQTEPGTIIVKLPGSIDEYRKTLSRSLRQNIRRQLKGLEREGEVKLVRLGSDGSQSRDGVSRLVEDAIAVSERSWQGQSGDGHAISSPDIRGFFTDVAVALARKGMTELSVLYVGSKPISFDWGVVRGGKMSGLKRGFDADFRQFGPGIVHFALLVEDSIERGMTEIDCGNEFSSYKKKWSHKEKKLCDVSYYPPGLRSNIMQWRRHRRGQKVGA
jgi:CelD/BcsL family acetyltransferase involved in cellulose biosynthesis